MISSCHSASDKKVQQLPISTVTEAEDTSNKEKTRSAQKPDIDVTKFVSLTDSLLSKIQGESITLSYIIDTITVKKRGIFSALSPSGKTLIRRYSFAPKQGDSRLHFWFVTANYADTIETNEAFEKLHRQADDMDDKTASVPGLTYTNDYVIRSENKIYWLNTGCAFAFIIIKK